MKLPRLLLPSPLLCQRGFTLIEALFSSTILIIGVAAAASLSLALTTQEEIAERSARSINYLDSAIALYRAGFEPAEIAAILPNEPAVKEVTFTPTSHPLGNYGILNGADITLTWYPSPATSAPGLERWTGGPMGAERSISLFVARINTTTPTPLPRLDYFE